MKTRLFLSFVSLVVLGAIAGCDDSQNPLSDPQKAKADAKLLGTWRYQDHDGNVSYYHIGHAGENLPEGVLRVVAATHHADGKLTSGEHMLFASTVGGSTYLNITDGKAGQVQALEENGWDATQIDGYFLYKYELKADTLCVQGIDRDAKRRAIEGKRLKGTVEPGDDGKVKFTDSTENLARFVAEAKDLFAKDVERLQRVK